MRAIAVVVAALSVGSCGEAGQRYLVAANHDVLIVVSDLEDTADPRQKQAIVHYRTAPRVAVNGVNEASTKDAFDCASGKVYRMSTILADGRAQPTSGETWQTPTSGSMGQRVHRIVCDSAALKKTRTGKSVDALVSAWEAVRTKPKA